MMERTCLSLHLFVLASCPLVSNAAGQNPTLSLKAVKVNGVPIPRANTTDVNPGDVVTAEIFIRDWTTTIERLAAYRTAINRDSFVSGTRGTVLPLGWDAPPTDDIGCTTSADCPTEFPVCQLFDVLGGLCIGPDHDPSIGVYIECARSDSVLECQPCFFPPCDDWFPAEIVGHTSIRYGQTLNNFGDAQTYSDPEKYAGTLIVKVSDDACGTFTFPFEPSGTELYDQDLLPLLPPALEPLVIRTATPPCKIVASVPPNCAIDPRQPIQPDGGEPTARDAIRLTFESDASRTAWEDFAICEPSDESPLTIEEFIPPARPGTTVILRLSDNIPIGQWTCICYLPRGEKACFAALPGDVDGDGTSGLQDIGALVDCLGDAAPCEVWRCDINQSGRCTPADLLREIDLLSGTVAFDPGHGLGLSTCPSTP